MTAILLILLSLMLPEELTRISTIIGAMIFVILFYLAYRLSLKRFYAIAAIALLVGVSSSVLFEDEAIGAGVTLSVTGLALIISGGLAFYTYLRRYPKANEV